MARKSISITYGIYSAQNFSQHHLKNILYAMQSVLNFTLHVSVTFHRHRTTCILMSPSKVLSPITIPIGILPKTQNIINLEVWKILVQFNAAHRKQDIYIYPCYSTLVVRRHSFIIIPTS